MNLNFKIKSIQIKITKILLIIETYKIREKLIKKIKLYKKN